MPEKIKAISLFSGAGIGELGLHGDRVSVIAANELVRQRADCYSFFYPETRMIRGDITDPAIKGELIQIANQSRAGLLIATPPCQGLSTLGKNKGQRQYENDRRNFLILAALEIVDACDFDYILIENVPKFIEMLFPYEGGYHTLEEILTAKYRDAYHIDIRVLNAKDYGVAQSRPRAIVKLWKKGLSWPWPHTEREITLREAIGHLPSLEPGEDSGVKWHYAKPQNERVILAMRHTAPGKSAIANEVYYPKKPDGTRIKGFHNTFKRMVWDQPCPARTTYCGSISSHNNVHPGYLQADGTYSDPRVLTLLETFLVSSIPEDIDFPPGVTDSFIRTVIGEAIPPRLMEKIIALIGAENDMPIMVEREKWILYKHTSNYELVQAVALDVKNSCGSNISDTERYRMQERLAALDLYKTRNPEERPLDSINHRINTLEFYMFGYEDKSGGQKRFIFSPLGNLYLAHISEPEKLVKIFTAMLFGIQFPHPANGTPASFRLYPFRLIFRLLTDERLGCRLYHAEYAYLVAFQKSVTPESYEKLVRDILAFRRLSRETVAARMKEDEHTYVNCVYEWQYYTQKLLRTAGILETFEGEELVRLSHPSKTNSSSAPTERILKTGYVTLNDGVRPFVEAMLAAHSCFQAPLPLDDPERMKLDVVKEIYAFYPQLLIDEIGEADELQVKLLELPKLIEAYSTNPENDTAYLFEDVLEEGFNMFVNVEARKMGGAGHTDIECLYLTRRKKFAVEAKSTANKLSLINAGRLNEHRQQIGGEYTIVITPRYVPAARRDIRGNPIVIILASTFSEYLYNHIYHDVREIDFEDFDRIIVENLGTDISKLISDKTMEKFAAHT